MSNPLPALPASALKGWRARVWAWVLFAALVKGLIPHAALASVLMRGDPALVWCAPGAQPAGSEGRLAGEMPAAEHSCVCASSGDAAMPFVRLVGPNAPGAHDLLSHTPCVPARAQRLLPPPARGPPAL